MSSTSQRTTIASTNGVAALLYHASYVLLYAIVTYLTNKGLFVCAAPILPTASWEPPNFTLDLSGVAAIVGGEEAISATVAAFTTGNSWYVGGYPPPGAYVVAKFFGRTIHGTMWKGMFPGERTELATAFNLRKPSKYTYDGLVSGTHLDKARSNIPDCLISENLVENIKDLNDLQDNGENSKIDLGDLNGKIHKIPGATGAVCSMFLFTAGEGWKDHDIVNVTPNRKHMVVGILASGVNAGICVVLGLMNDWFALAIIVAGMVVNFLFMGTVSSCIISVSKHSVKDPARTPPGHGIFSHGEKNTFITVFGEEDSINSIAKTQLEVGPKRKSSDFKLGVCCTAMYMLFWAQLIIPAQASLIGQIFFLVSLICGWAANAYYSSLDASEAQRQIVKENCGAELKAVLRGNRTAVLMTLAFLFDLKGQCLTHIYPRLLANNSDWLIAMNCIQNSIDAKSLVIDPVLKGTLLESDLSNAWKEANKLKGKQELIELMDFKNKSDNKIVNPVDSSPPAA
ncbi:hypothetical protein BGW37DRAFT_254918 [Umbelopsis sp. PMI_123]|nr:hypothetical protein BGW37DRAFT_254918 [Umbelopsis sp. PMI_123]